MKLQWTTTLARGFGTSLAIFLVAGSASAAGVMRITEWMYGSGEFVEFTNVGDAAIDLTGWSFDDNSRVAGTLSLSAFGLVAAGESVLLAQNQASVFRSLWGLDGSVKVIGSNTVAALDRADEINLFDSSSALVDRLTYNDALIGGPRTASFSANIAFSNLGLNRADLAIASFVGDAYGSYESGLATPGNPGLYSPIPEPGTAALLGLGLLGLGARRRIAPESAETR